MDKLDPANLPSTFEEEVADVHADTTFALSAPEYTGSLVSSSSLAPRVSEQSKQAQAFRPRLSSSDPQARAHFATSSSASRPIHPLSLPELIGRAHLFTFCPP